MTRESSAQPQKKLPPRPYLTREETNRVLEKIGFRFHPDGRLDTNVLDNNIVRQKMVLERLASIELLIAGAIAEWAGVEQETPGGWESINDELQEWTEEWLVG